MSCHEGYLVEEVLGGRACLEGAVSRERVSENEFFDEEEVVGGEALCLHRLPQPVLRNNEVQELHGHHLVLIINNK